MIYGFWLDGGFMGPQVDRENFIKAITELGHDPNQWVGKQLSIEKSIEIYKLKESDLLDAIDKDLIQAQYDYPKDTLWLDALDVAHFSFCILNEAHLYSKNISAK